MTTMVSIADYADPIFSDVEKAFIKEMLNDINDLLRMKYVNEVSVVTIRSQELPAPQFKVSERLLSYIVFLYDAWNVQTSEYQEGKIYAQFVFERDPSYKYNDNMVVKFNGVQPSTPRDAALLTEEEILAVNVIIERINYYIQNDWNFTKKQAIISKNYITHDYSAPRIHYYIHRMFGDSGYYIRDEMSEITIYRK